MAVVISSTKSRVPWDSFLANSKIPQGQTDEVLTWISKVNQKVNIVRSTKYRDYRKEVLLENSRKSAREFLKSKQEERRQRWRLLKKAISQEENKATTNIKDNFEHICGYCSVRASPVPGQCCFNKKLYSESGTAAHYKVLQDDESRKVDEFLASLPSRSQKRSAEEDRSYARKRCKA